MKAPDKIYVEIRHPFGNEFTEIVGFENKGNSEDIKYIRKDALLEWAKGEIMPGNSTEGKGWNLALQTLIDKLNSM